MPKEKTATKCFRFPCALIAEMEKVWGHGNVNAEVAKIIKRKLKAKA